MTTKSKLKTIPEVDENEKIDYLCSRPVKFVDFSSDKLNFVRKMPIIHDFSVCKSDSTFFSHFPSKLNTKHKKTIYQMEKEKLNNDRECPKFLRLNQSIDMTSDRILSPVFRGNITEQESRAVYFPFGKSDLPHFPKMSDKVVANTWPYEYLGSEKASVLKIFISSPKKPIKMVFFFAI